MEQQRKIMNLEGLTRRMARHAGVSQDEAKAYISALFELLRTRLPLSEGDPLLLEGIGSFVIDRDSADGMRFIPERELADKINEPFALFEPVELADDTDAAIAAGEEPAPQTPAPPSAPEEPAELPLSADTDDYFSVADLEPEPMEQAAAALYTPQKPPEEPAPAEPAPPAPVPAVVAHTPGKAYRFGWFAAGLLIGLLMGWMATALYYSDFFATADDETADEPAAEVIYDTADEESAPADHDEDESATPAAAAIGAGSDNIMRTDTVTPRRYITHMAQDYYGNRAFWVYIYEANADILGHPERTLPGTVVRIPSPASIPANSDDPAQLQAARQLAADIYARFR